MEDSDQDSSSEFSTTEDSAVDSPIAKRIALARVATNAGSQEKSKETSGTQKITQEPTKEELGAFVVQLDLSHCVNVPIYRLRVFRAFVFNLISFGLHCLMLQRRRGELNKKKISLSLFDNILFVQLV